MRAAYRFVPWVREGAATAIRTVDTLGVGVAGRPALPLGVRVNERVDASVSLRLYGPGDVSGFDTRIVVRTDPPNLASAFEPNYFPAIEFDFPALPWLLTPATGDSKARLRPWLCLVIVRRQPGVTLTSARNHPLPVLGIRPPAVPAAELPELAESWAWAHAQVVASDDVPLRDLLMDRDAEPLSRLVCPRRLLPDEAYMACVVPAFAAGRRAGLGEPPGPEDEELTPAWRLSDDLDAVELPVYFHWEFRTGSGGDFESLVRRLRGQVLPKDVGRCALLVGAASFGLPDGGVLPFEGALRPPNGEPDPGVPTEFRDALLHLLNTPDDLHETVGEAEPILAPPIYGGWQAARRRIDGDSPVWIRAANLDPRYRAAAGLGTLVVQDQQEMLMASAWDQLGALGREQSRTQQRELARTVLGTVHRGLERLSPENLLRITGPMHARVRLGGPVEIRSGERVGPAARTVLEQIRLSTLPIAVTSPSFRRVTRPNGPLLRHTIGPSARSSESASSAAQPSLPRRPPGFTARFTAVRPAPGLVATPTTPASPSTVTAAAIDRRIQTLIVPSTMIAQAGQFNATVREMSAYLTEVAGGDRTAKRPVLELSSLRLAMLKEIDPARTLPQPVAAPVADASSRGEPASPIVTSSVARSLPGPSFPQPMYAPLRELAPEMLLPGLERIPPNSVTLLETNPGFIEGYMLGLNHEMSRELLWREYPSDLRATCFRHFWGGNLEMPEVHTWAEDGALGTHLDAGDDGRHLVLLIRGELLQRYPRAVIYALPAVGENTPGTDKRYPIFRAALTPDTTCLGFDLSADEVRGGGGSPGWFFVIEQPPGQPRFGLDESNSVGRDPTELKSWNDVAWGDMADSDDELSRLGHATAMGRLHGRRIGPLEWGLNAGHLAAITLQRPVRVMLRASELLPPSPRVDHG